MSMGSYGAYAETVTKEFVEKMCPLEYRIFMDTLEAAEVDFDTFCQVVYDDFDDELNGIEEEKTENIFNAYEKLQTEFVLKTGLSLDLVYHEADNRGDMLDGGSFALDGVYEMTPAAKKIEEHICRKWWTTFG